MKFIGKIFAFIYLFDRRWFYSPIVSFADSNGSSSRSKDEGSKKGVAVSKDETQRSGLARSRSTIPDEAEMRRVFQQFDENKDGVIASDELGRFMKRLGFELSDDELQSLVKTVDCNCDGTLDFDEFYSLYSSLAGSDTKTSSNDHEKDFEKDQEDNLWAAFQVFDKDQNGYITVQELQSVLQSLGMEEGSSLKKCYQMIQGVDDDGDGQVNFEEFKKMMHSDAFQS